MRVVALLFAVLVAAPVSAQGQTSTQTAAVPSLPTLASSIPVGSRVGELSSSYDDGGRRDPFGSLVTPRRSTQPAADGARPRSGLAGLALADITVRGIVRSGQTMLAILEGPNKQSFVTRVKDRLFDATVVSVDADGVVFSEQMEGGRAVNQVRRSLRPSGEGVR